MRAIRALGCLFLCLASAPSPAAAQPQTALVEVRSNFFAPQTVHISPGDTVTWQAKDNGHTVTAEDFRFNFFPNRTLNRDESVSFTFLTDETVPYYCRIHGARGGQGMSGVIVVGAGSPTPTPPPPPPREERTVPSPAYATLRDALRDVPPGSLVNVLPGTYRESVIVDAPGVTIRGTGAAPADVVLDGGGTLRAGITVVAGDARVENLTVRRYAEAGMSFQNVRGFHAENLAAEENGGQGIAVSGSRRGILRDIRAAGSGSAGVFVRQCRDCDTLLDGIEAEGNLFGVSISNAQGIVLRDSTIRANSTGVLLRTAAALDAPQQGTHVVGNTIENNVVQPPPGAEPAPPAGVWILGGWQNVVEANTVTGHDYGILVTLLSAFDRVQGNTLDESRLADLAWDGIGAGVCFSGNGAPGGGAPTSDPPFAQDIYSCSLPLTIGVPSPTVLVSLALYAAGQRP